MEVPILVSISFSKKNVAQMKDFCCPTIQVNGSMDFHEIGMCPITGRSPLMLSPIGQMEEDPRHLEKSNFFWNFFPNSRN